MFGRSRKLTYAMSAWLCCMSVLSHNRTNCVTYEEKVFISCTLGGSGVHIGINVSEEIPLICHNKVEDTMFWMSMRMVALFFLPLKPPVKNKWVFSWRLHPQEFSNNLIFLICPTWNIRRILKQGFGIGLYNSPFSKPEKQWSTLVSFNL